MKTEMKTNTLTQKEFESIFLSIVKLESKETLFTIISKIFHIPVSILNNIPIPDYLYSVNKDSKKTKYRGYDVRAKYALWDKEHQEITIELKTRWSIINNFIFTPKSITKKIKKICSKEIYHPDIPNTIKYSPSFRPRIGFS